VETSETERWQNGKMERSSAKNLHCQIMKLCKKQIFGEQTAAAWNDVIAKKIASGQPEDWTVCGPCHL